MIRAWRLCRAPFADLSGEGARLYGGRWNSTDWPLVYLAENSALAVLAVRVHLDLPRELVPDDYVVMQIDLPDEPPEDVSGMPADPRAVGDGWLRDRRTAVLRVPSVLALTATNPLLNPGHPRTAEAAVMSMQPFRFDPCLWSGS